jgi:hypothetical protein
MATTTAGPMTITTGTINLLPLAPSAPPAGFALASVVLSLFNTTSSNVNLPTLRLALAQYIGVSIDRVFAEIVPLNQTDRTNVRMTVQSPVRQAASVSNVLNTLLSSPTFFPAIRAAAPGATSFASSTATVQMSREQLSNVARAATADDDDGSERVCHFVS